MDLKELLDEIMDIVEQYKRFGNTTPNYQLLEQRIQLSALLVTLADQTGIARADFEKAYYQRKRAFHKEKVELMKTMSGTKAESEAYVATAEYVEKEKTLEGIFNRLNVIRQSVTEVLSCMNQQISIRRQEKAEAKHQV